MEVKRRSFIAYIPFVHMTGKGGLVITCKTLMRIIIEQVLEQV